jgi:hypothetical protein
VISVVPKRGLRVLRNEIQRKFFIQPDIERAFVVRKVGAAS